MLEELRGGTNGEQLEGGNSFAAEEVFNSLSCHLVMIFKSAFKTRLLRLSDSSLIVCFPW